MSHSLLEQYAFSPELTWCLTLKKLQQFYTKLHTWWWKFTAETEWQLSKMLSPHMGSLWASDWNKVCLALLWRRSSLVWFCLCIPRAEMQLPAPCMHTACAGAAQQCRQNALVSPLEKPGCYCCYVEHRSGHREQTLLNNHPWFSIILSDVSLRLYYQTNH